MQMKKAGAVAFGALATVAVLGAPAAASAPSLHEVGAQFFGTGVARDGWGAPWGGPQQSLVSVGTGSVANAAAWQVCGSDAVAGIGLTLNASSPDTVLDGCTNANVWLKQDTVKPVIGALNDSAVSVASWQACGSTIGGGIAATIAIGAPHTVLGDCDNSNIVIGGPDDHYTEGTTVAAARHSYGPMATRHSYGPQQKAALKAAKVNAKRQRLATKLAGVGGNQSDVVRAAFMARKNDMLASKQHVTRTAASPKHMGDWGSPWDIEPQSLISVGSGSAAQVATWQACGGTAVWGVGAVLTSGSPNTVFGDCRNATVHITQDDPTAVISVLDNSSVNVAAWQVCGSNTVAGVGGTISLLSPNTVFGGCHNADTIID
jgi:hypothetical protein